MLDTIEVQVAADAEAGSAHPLVALTREAAEHLAPGLSVSVRTVDPDPDTVPSGRARVALNGRVVGRSRAGEDADMPDWMVGAAIAHALEPRHILFMCVANSARSQLADAMARHLAPPEVTVSSAGSEPTSLRPEVGIVLRELGLSTVGLHSKSTDDVDTVSVQLVVTLCADEVCPTLLRPVPRLHWPLPDPAAVEGEGRTDAFRAARDAIRERLYVLFHG